MEKFFFLKAGSLNQIKNPRFAVALLNCQTKGLSFFNFRSIDVIQSGTSNTGPSGIFSGFRVEFS